jgi:hypothetical protein
MAEINLEIIPLVIIVFRKKDGGIGGCSKKSVPKSERFFDNRYTKMIVVRKNPRSDAGNLLKEKRISVIPGRPVHLRYRQPIGVLQAHCN